MAPSLSQRSDRGSGCDPSVARGGDLSQETGWKISAVTRGVGAAAASTNHSRPSSTPKAGDGSRTSALKTGEPRPGPVSWERWAARAACFCAALGDGIHQAVSGDHYHRAMAVGGGARKPAPEMQYLVVGVRGESHHGCHGSILNHWPSVSGHLSRDRRTAPSCPCPCPTGHGQRATDLAPVRKARSYRSRRPCRSPASRSSASTRSSVLVPVAVGPRGSLRPPLLFVRTNSDGGQRAEHQGLDRSADRRQRRHRQCAGPDARGQRCPPGGHRPARRCAQATRNVFGCPASGRGSERPRGGRRPRRTGRARRHLGRQCRPALQRPPAGLHTPPDRPVAGCEPARTAPAGPAPGAAHGGCRPRPSGHDRLDIGPDVLPFHLALQRREVRSARLRPRLAPGSARHGGGRVTRTTGLRP